MLYAIMGVAFFIPQKVIGERNYGIYILAQALLTFIYTLSDGFALQAMVNFGMDTSRRPQALTVSGLTHLSFISFSTAAIYFGREGMAQLLSTPELAETLTLFPLVSLGFLLRTYLVKVSQLHIDTRGTFIIDLAWVGSTIGLLVAGWRGEWLATSDDMMIIAALSSAFSSLVGLLLYASRLRFTLRLDPAYSRRMLGFGTTQIASAVTLAAQSQGDVLLLGRFASPAIVGNYDAAKKIFRAFEALKDAGSLFVYPAVARLVSQGREKEMVLLVEKMIGFTFLVITPIVICVWLGPTEQIFELVYKGAYKQAPAIFKVMSLAALAIPFSLNLSVLAGLGEARKFLRVTATSAVGLFIVALLFIPAFGGIGAALTLVASYILLGGLATHAVRQRIDFSLRSSFGRWRDAAEFGARTWQRLIVRKNERAARRSARNRRR
jgi:O-antigen/teichoic acid export membrane protein